MGKPSSKFAVRYLMAVLGSMGLAILYGFKVNASIALVAMINHTALKLNVNHTTLNVTSTNSQEVNKAFNFKHNDRQKKVERKFLKKIHTDLGYFYF